MSRSNDPAIDDILDEYLEIQQMKTKALIKHGLDEKSVNEKKENLFWNLRRKRVTMLNLQHLQSLKNAHALAIEGTPIHEMESLLDCSKIQVKHFVRKIQEMNKMSVEELVSKGKNNFENNEVVENVLDELHFRLRKSRANACETM